jgi:hypothetical protein
MSRAFWVAVAAAFFPVVLIGFAVRLAVEVVLCAGRAARFGYTVGHEV